MVSSQFTSDVGLGKVAVAAFGIGFVMAAHLCLLFWVILVNDASWIYYNAFLQWAVYMVCLTFFHFSEFISTAAFKPGYVSYESFLLNHSDAYQIALFTSWAEYWVEAYFFPSAKFIQFFMWIGLGLIVMGQLFRVGAMWTAKSNFSHRIEIAKRKDHQLITHGLYKYIRHPSYFGWFYWSVGSQVFLCNPLCTIAYTAASWSFFKDRIPYEEEILLDFFPEEYPQYKARTISGVPFL
ncbi:isoprenylcysteine carboxyl methyltransferase [Thraustotheca clavata]|uniref:Protein-S-isoprenylcysteine O-methyltransferase n=1 Tax=Thraustotheca clavata TaxID=74557 RepID=A0A1V9ZHG4_9STRA|nr:isoprenylcysteine carboxyl methyltransferase [Thraustotheca clavata]